MREENLEVSSFEEASLLRALGRSVVETRFDPDRGRAGRVVLVFTNDGGKARRVLRRHRGEGVAVNSRACAEGLDKARSLIFRARDAR